MARLAAEVIALRQPSTHHPGLHRFFQGATWLWAGIFLLLTAGLAVLMVTEPASPFLMLSTVGNAHRKCELVYVKGDEIGVRFLQKAEGKRRPRPMFSENEEFVP